MATQHDWTKEAAREIAEVADIFSDENLETIAAIIEKHCPLKRDVAYVEVGAPAPLTDSQELALEIGTTETRTIDGRDQHPPRVPFNLK